MDKKSIENKIVELRLRERQLIETRNKLRATLLYNAEKLPFVNSIIDDFFVHTLGCSQNEVDKYSMQGRCSGENDEQYLTEAVVILTSDNNIKRASSEFSELSIKLRVIKGFEDEHVREQERVIMNDLNSIREEIQKLTELKKRLKYSAR